MQEQKLPPHNIEAEESILGSLLIDPEAFPRVRSIVSGPDFHREKNRWVFEACEDVHQKSTINQVTVSQRLSEKGKLDDIGGPVYLSHLVAVLPTSVGVEHYARVVKECSAQRQLITLGMKIVANAYAFNPVPESIANGLAELLALRRQEQTPGRLKSFKEIADQHRDRFSEWLEEDMKLRGLSTGFLDLDRAIDGLEDGKLYIAAGRPSMGKTMFLIKLAEYIAEMGTTVALFSLEQNERAILERMVLAKAGLDRYQARQAGSDAVETNRLWVAYEDSSRLPIWVDDTAAITTTEVNSRLLSFQIDHDVGLLLFDYIDLSGDKKGDSEELRIAGITRRLRDIAKTANIPVVAACQLNRDVEKRADKHPQLSDLRYSGALEQLADVVMLLYRDEYYSVRHVKDECLDKKNILEVIIAKNKDGPVGKVDLFYDASMGRMASLEKS